METQTDPIVFQEDIMIKIHLSNGSFEVNEELLPVIRKTAAYFGLSGAEDLTKVTEEDFFTVFTPLMNAHYGLK